MNGDAQVFRADGWVGWVVLAGCVVSCIGALALFLSEGSGLYSAGLVLLASFFLVAYLENRHTRVQLTDDQLLVAVNFRAHYYARSDLLRVVAEKGCPVAIETRSGAWIQLPETISSLHPNTLRAWIRRVAPAESGGFGPGEHTA